jgi:chemotaxis-related protein WspD
MDRKTAAGAVPQDAHGEIIDCWNTIGIGGDASCRELERFIQCRNCPVFAKAGLQLLNRALPPAYRQERTKHFAEKRKPAGGARISAVIFRVDREWLALPTQAFQEVAEHCPIHSIPHRRHGVLLGLVNIRGELLPCVSVGRLLGLESGASPERLRAFHNRLLVTLWDGKRLAFPADDVHGICRIQAEELTPPPATVAKAASTFTQGLFAWQGRMVGLLEPELFFLTLNRSLS